MTAVFQGLHFLAGLVVLAEALNKLERTAPCAPGLTQHERVVDGLKALAWSLLALGGAGAVAYPVLSSMGMLSAHDVIYQAPSPSDIALMLGFAVLIVRTRIKEG